MLPPGPHLPGPPPLDPVGLAMSMMAAEEALGLGPGLGLGLGLPPPPGRDGWCTRHACSAFLLSLHCTLHGGGIFSEKIYGVNAMGNA